jgi:hypothetical protein
MSVLLFLKVLTRWETLLVSAVLMILIPLVTYLAALRPRVRRLQFIAPAEKALEEAPAEALE